MQDIWTAIVAAVTTVVCNAVFFKIIKEKVDRRIEQYKIAYSGIFQEKLKFYKKLLKNIDELQDRVLKYGHSTDDKYPIDLINDVVKFDRLNKYGSVFYPEEIYGIVKTIKNKFQDVIGASLTFKIASKSGTEDKKITNDYIEKLGELTNSKEMMSLQDKLIQYIRSDFGPGKT